MREYEKIKAINSKVIMPGGKEFECVDIYYDDLYMDTLLKATENDKERIEKLVYDKMKIKRK